MALLEINFLLHHFCIRLDFEELLLFAFEFQVVGAGLALQLLSFGFSLFEEEAIDIDLAHQPTHLFLHVLLLFAWRFFIFFELELQILDLIKFDGNLFL